MVLAIEFRLEATREAGHRTRDRPGGTATVANVRDLRAIYLVTRAPKLEDRFGCGSKSNPDERSTDRIAPHERFT